MKNEIIFLNPVFTHNIWGGTKLRDEYGYDIEGDDIGECWGTAPWARWSAGIFLTVRKMHRLL